MKHSMQKGGRRHKKSCRGGKRKTYRGGRKTHRRTGGQTASHNLALSQQMNQMAENEIVGMIEGAME